MKTSYRTNLTDEQWEIIRTLIPEAQRGRAVRRRRRLEAFGFAQEVAPGL